MPVASVVILLDFLNDIVHCAFILGCDAERTRQRVRVFVGADGHAPYLGARQGGRGEERQ